MEQRELTFSIQGEFITQLAREKCAEGEWDYAMNLLLSCMDGTGLSKRKLRQMAFSILNGEARLKGTYPEKDYGFEYLDEPLKYVSVGNIFSRLLSELNEAKTDVQKYQDRYSVAMEYVPEYEWDEVLKETGQKPDNEDIPNGALMALAKLTGENDPLGSYMKRMTDTSKHSTEDYGWLEPNGTFHNVSWGEHLDFAQEWLEKNHPEIAEDSDVDMQIKCNVGLIGASDWLVERGWVLLHNPSQGIAFPTKNPLKPYTKAQKEFLYDYYMERNCPEKANEIFKEED